MYVNVCLNCREEFNPIEGNETREFCSDFCESENWDKEDNTLHYNYGRK